MGFAKRLKELRELHHMTQHDLAKHLKITRQAIGNYEQGTRFPADEKLLCSIADLFKVSLDFLLGRVNFYELPPGSSNPFIKETISSYYSEQDKAIQNLLHEVSNFPIESLDKLIETIQFFKTLHK